MRQVGGVVEGEEGPTEGGQGVLKKQGEGKGREGAGEKREWRGEWSRAGKEG